MKSFLTAFLLLALTTSPFAMMSQSFYEKEILVWEIDGQNLVSMISSIEVTNRNHPWLEEYFSLQDEFTLNEKNSEEIVVLSDDYINLQPSSGKPYECYKVDI